MFEELFGLPAHPLLVHAPVVLVPLTVLTAVAYALVPPLRRRIGWLLVLLSLAAAATAFAATESGEEFAASLGGVNPTIAQHQEYGETLRNFAILVAVISVVLVVVDRARRSRSALAFAEDGSPHTYARARSGGMVLGAVSIVLSIGLLALAGAAAFYVVRAGHTGAEMVWGAR